MFTKSAEFYDALYHFKDYAQASQKLSGIIKKINPEAKTLLDTACGTGKHIEKLKIYFECDGLDISGKLLEIAEKRCPGNKFHKGDITDFSLNKKYDVVTCLFSSIAYVKTGENLIKAVRCMSDHLNEKGLLIIEPWFSKETFWTNTITANHYDSKDLKISWMYNSKSENDMSVLDINYLVGTPEEVTYFTERHELGLFSDLQYRKSMEDCGLEVDFDKEGLFGRGMYTGIKNL
ncbi:MAG: class I SAM-dependent methyltransferase [Ignavibacteria bacterium]|nr:class I SAM-dependent methyltransferase [Ignavibacteria bacterium]